jgi:hypothetical protein
MQLSGHVVRPFRNPYLARLVSVPLDLYFPTGHSLGVRLVDDLAACRLFYSRPLPTLPDVLLIDIPAAYASPSLPLGRYYPVILETDTESREMAAFLDAERPAMVVPDLFDYRPSALMTDDIVFARYAPPLAGWPWLLLCRWPVDYTALVPQRGDYFARGAYTSETFETVEELAQIEVRLLDTLGSHRPVRMASNLKIMGHA